MLGKLEITIIGEKKKAKPNRKMVDMVCEECGEPYQSFTYESKKRRFCSRTCASRNFNRTRIKDRGTRKCEFCGKEIVLTAKTRNKRFCDWTCSNRASAEKKKLAEVGI